MIISFKAMILSVWVVKVVASRPEKAEEGRVRQGFGSVGSFSAKNAIFQFEDVFFLKEWRVDTICQSKVKQSMWKSPKISHFLRLYQSKFFLNRKQKVKKFEKLRILER